MTPPSPRLSGAKADLHELLVGLIKCALVDDAAGSAPWRTDALAAQKRLVSLSDTIEPTALGNLWALAVKDAECDPLVRREETVNPTLPMTAPFGLNRLSADPFDWDGAVQTIRDTASFG